MPVVSFLYMKNNRIHILELREKERTYGNLSEWDRKILQRREELVDISEYELNIRKSEIESELRWQDDQLTKKQKIKRWWSESGLGVVFIIILIILAFLGYYTPCNELDIFQC